MLFFFFVVFKEKYIKKQILFNKYYMQKDYCKVGRSEREEACKRKDLRP